jgi:type III secretion protein S
MYTTTALDLTHNALMIAMLLSLPAAITAAVIGLLVGIAQAITSIQDQSLPQSIKIIAVMVVLLLTGGWMGTELMTFGNDIFRNFPLVVRK